MAEEGNADLERISGSEPLPAALQSVPRRGPRAWQPVTPRGVAAFARAKWTRLLIVCLVVDLVIAGTVLWFVARCWVPVVLAAIAHLPQTGQIQRGQLFTPRLSPEPLATNPFIGIGVDIGARANANAGTDIYVTFHHEEVLACSFLGCMVFAYPEGWTIQFNRPQLEPWWGAWSPMLSALLLGGIILVFAVSWLSLGLLYSPVAWLVGASRGRKFSWNEAWRLATACNLPGGCLFAVALLGYLAGVLGLVPFAILAVAQFPVAWVYLAVCPGRVPEGPAASPRSDPPRVNPFGHDRPPTAAARGKNVFRPGT